MGLEIVVAKSERELETFLRVPALLRPETRFARAPDRWLRPLLDQRKNPYFRHADHVFMIAYRDGLPAGRVAAFVDHLCNRARGERAGLFGLFDCLDSQRVASELLAAAERWLLEHQVSVVRGPIGPSLRLGTGVLVEGHNEPGMPGTTFDPPEIGPLIESAGYEPFHDLYAHRLRVGSVPRDVVDAADRARRRRGLTIGSLDTQRLDDAVGKIRDVMRDSSGLGLACAPMTEDELRWTVTELWFILETSLVLHVEQDGVPAAAGVALRNVREVYRGQGLARKLSNPTAVAAARRLGRVKSARIALLAVRPPFRNVESPDQGDLAALLLVEILGRLGLMGVEWAEISPVDSADAALLWLLDQAGAERIKLYRVYEKKWLGADR